MGVSSYRGAVVCLLYLLGTVLSKDGAATGEDHAEVDLKEHAKHYYSERQGEYEENSSTKSESDGKRKSSRTDFDGPRLVRLHGGQVGDVQEIQLGPDLVRSLRTVNLKPLIFEIQDFFTPDECQHIIDLAKEAGLEASSTHQITNDNNFRLLDSDGDEKLSLHEMIRTIEDGFDVYLDEDDVKEMYFHLQLDSNHDDFISKEEMSRLSLKQLMTYIKNLVASNPIKKSRFSEQAWIYPDKTKDAMVADFQQRLVKLTQLPEPLIQKFSFFQVVRYGPHGHYNAHLDSGDSIGSLPCCHLTKHKRCSICRFMTIMVYLNDVEEGGETAFIVANNDTFDDVDLRESGHINLNNYCRESNLRIRPERGKAVIWYNHFVDEATGWMGQVDHYTWHGGCPVIRGEKWIMNRWISASKDPEVDLA
ncbi:transmembrane prolyl 4-hydroxylase-like [Diadema antillarum]|uniref:transmembrane prolyl 4-hydroxylase-like n=1 Tax=Diadema antillarum TaxID=105358 RepID=UPI003A8BA658